MYATEVNLSKIYPCVIHRGLFVPGEGSSDTSHKIISSKMEVALLQYIAIHCNARSGWIGYGIYPTLKKLHRLKIVLKLIYFGIGRLSFFIFQQIPK